MPRFLELRRGGDESRIATLGAYTASLYHFQPTPKSMERAKILLFSATAVMALEGTLAECLTESLATLVIGAVFHRVS
jgi:hypothetical protein